MKYAHPWTQHCPACAVGWKARWRNCWACGRFGRLGTIRSRNGRTRTWRPTLQQETLGV